MKLQGSKDKIACPRRVHAPPPPADVRPRSRSLSRHQSPKPALLKQNPAKPKPKKKRTKSKISETLSQKTVKARSLNLDQAIHSFVLKELRRDDPREGEQFASDERTMPSKNIKEESDKSKQDIQKTITLSQEQRVRFEKGLERSLRMAGQLKRLKGVMTANRRREEAALRIQKNWRAFRVRKHLFEQFQKLQSQLQNEQKIPAQLNRIQAKKEREQVKEKEKEKEREKEKDEQALPLPPEMPILPIVPSLSFNNQLRQELAEMRIKYGEEIEQLREELRALKEERGHRREPVPPPEPARHEPRLSQERLNNYRLQEKYYLVQVRLDQRIKLMTESTDHAFAAPSIRLLLDRTTLLLLESTPELLERLNRPQGLGSAVRLRLLHGYSCPEHAPAHRSVLEGRQIETLLEGVPESQLDFSRAVLYSLDQHLRGKQPNSGKSGPPFPWTVAVEPPALTSHTLPELLDNCKDQIVKASKTLCGLLLVEEESGQLGGIQTVAIKNSLLNKKRLNRLGLALQDYGQRLDREFGWHEDQRADLLMDTADEIFDLLAKEMAGAMKKMVRLRDLKL